MKQVESARGIRPSDVLVAVMGGLCGLAIGYLIGSGAGRINRRRVGAAVRRWRERLPAAAAWTDEDAERLEARVLDALSGDVVLARRPIRVGVLGRGLVELTGAVQRAAEVELAGDVVRGVPGVETVLNHLLVEVAARPGAPVGGPDAPRAARG